MLIVVKGGQKTMIKKVSVKGFRNIPKCEIHFGDITGLLSTNSYGKSNVLKAIEFGFDYINAPLSIKDNMLGWKKGFPYNTNALSKTFSFEMEIHKKIKSTVYNIVYGYTFSWRLNENSDAKIIEEHMKVKEVGSKQIYSNYINRNHSSAMYKTSKTGRCSKQISIKEQELVVNKILAFDDLFYHDFIQIINSFEIYIDKHLDATNAFEPDPIIRKNNDILSLATTDNIPRTLYFLKQNYASEYSYLENVFMQLFPKVERLTLKSIKLNNNSSDMEIPEEFEFVDKVYMLFCKEKNVAKAINFQQMSDGARRILLLLTNLILAKLNHVPLICIEEPENSINPSLLQQYIEVMYDIAGDTKILLTSHSPYLINYLNPANIYIGCQNDEDLVDFHKIKNSAIHRLYQDASNTDMNYGDYIFDLLSDDINRKDIEKYVESE